MKQFRKFGIKLNKLIPVDKFIEKFYTPQILDITIIKSLLEKYGDFILRPLYLIYFLEIIAIWIISLGKILISQKDLI